MKDYTASNIKALRNMYGESQMSLAIALGFDSKSTILNYEKGTRKISSEVISKIAEHYWITEEVLVHYDLSDLPKLDLSELKISDAADIGKDLIPFVYTDHDLENTHFEIAYRIHKEYLEGNNTKLLEGVKGDEMFKNYSLAYQEGVVDAGVNFLSFLFPGVLHLRITGQIEPYYDLPSDMDFKEALIEYLFVQYGIGDDEEAEIEMTQEQEELIDKTDGLARDVIHNLIKSHNYELADYIKALRYYCGTIKKEKHIFSSSMIGANMLCSQVEFKNPYAMRMLYSLYCVCE